MYTFRKKLEKNVFILIFFFIFTPEKKKFNFRLSTQSRTPPLHSLRRQNVKCIYLDFSCIKALTMSSFNLITINLIILSVVYLYPL
jgi:hypothetical protein